MLDNKSLTKKSNNQPSVQCNLKVGQPNDQFEQEADNAADQVMKINDSKTVQMEPAEDEEEEVQAKIQMQPMEGEGDKFQMKPSVQKTINGDQYATPEIGNKLNSTKGSGENLPNKLGAEMGRKIGGDFSGTKIHTDSQAINMNRELGAQAFTHGSDIYFNQGKYDPGSSKGKHLLAHELTHVVQQGTAPGMKKINKFGYEEHQSVGDAASGGALVTLFPGKGKLKSYTISYGEMVALAGDYFKTLKDMKDLAATESGQRMLDYARSKGGNVKVPEKITHDEKKYIDEQYYALNANNYAHFTPAVTHNNNLKEYLEYHERAINKAFKAGQNKEPINEATLLESFGGHFLTDAFTGGHMTSPRQAAKEHWINIYPLFIDNFINHLTEYVATHINDKTFWAGTFLTVAGLKERVMKIIKTKLPPGIKNYSLGGLLSVAVHDWYNAKGLDVVSKVDESGNKVKGGHKWKAFGEIITLDERKAQPQKQMVIAALKVGLKDVNDAYNAKKISELQKLKPYKVLDYIPQVDTTSKSNIDFKWKFKDIKGLVANPVMMKAVKFMLSDVGSVGSMFKSVTGDIDNEDAKIAFNSYFSQLKGNTENMLKQIANYVPGGKSDHYTTDDMSRKYVSDLSKTDSVKSLTTAQMVGMIKKMMSGDTGNEDEAAILTILEGATEQGNIIEVIDGVGGFLKLADDFHGDEWHQLLDLLRKGYFIKISQYTKYSLLYYIYDNNASGEWREEAFIEILEAAKEKDKSEYTWLVKSITSKDKDLIDDFLDGDEQKRFDALK